MARKNENVPQYDYNIYRLPLGKVDDFINYILERKFEEINIADTLLPDKETVHCTLYFCDKDSANGSSWINLLSDCAGVYLDSSVRIYGAALVYRFTDVCYVISYGNAHFYINGFCDYDFGTEVAEHLLNMDNIKSQQNLSYGSKTSKTHVDYLSGATLTYGSGEVPNFIRGGSINEEDWGLNLNCGTSAQFKWPEKPLNLVDRLQKLSIALKEKSSYKLPRLLRLDAEKDAVKIHELNVKLAKAIKENDSSHSGSRINIPSFFLVGTKYFQNDFIGVKLTCNGKRRQYEDELTIPLLNSFISDVGCNIENDLTSINVSFLRADNLPTPLKPVLDYMEFITDDNFCLRDGKWCSFNAAYLQQIWNGLVNLKINNHVDDEFAYKSVEILEYAKNKGIYQNATGNKAAQQYETYYNHFLADKLEAICNHPDLTQIDPREGGKYQVEPCDIYKDDKLYYVKLGAPNDFAYAIDQVQLALSLIEKGNGSLTLKSGTVLYPKTVSLVLVFKDRKTTVAEWKDIKSVNFLLHLADLKRRINQSYVALEVNLVYAQQAKD